MPSNEMTQSGFSMEQPMQANSAVANTNASREMEEVKGQIFMAKQFPRNQFEAEKRILDACKRPSLAKSAMYSYPRGGQNVTGPSVRLAEVLAQNWGNIAFGFKELDQNDDESEAMAYAWDVETNTRQERIFKVPHYRHTRSGTQHLTDPRDIYELVANNASRRVRACILSIVPGDIVESAIEECNKTLSGDNPDPLKDRLAVAFDSFKNNLDVTQNQIEEYFGYGASEFSESNYTDLISIFTSIRDGISKKDDYFKPAIIGNPESEAPQSGSGFDVPEGATKASTSSVAKSQSTKGAKSHAKTDSKSATTKAKPGTEQSELLQFSG